MKIKDFVTAFVPSLERSEIHDELTRLKKELEQSTLPVFMTAQDQFQYTRFTHQDNEAFNKSFLQAIRNVRVGTRNWISIATSIFDNTQNVLSLIDNDIDGTFSRDVTKEGMTYKGVNMLQYLEMASFAIRYARRRLQLTTAKEFEKATGETQSPLVPAEAKWLTANQTNFFNAMSLLAVSDKDAKRFFADVPNAIVTPDEVEVMTSNVGIQKVDPFQMGLINARLSPIYYIGMGIAEWQVKRYNLAKEEQKALEFRLQMLKELQDEGRRDAKMEKEIHYIEDRINKYSAKIAKMEED